MGCKPLDVMHVDQGSGNENKVLRLLGGTSSSAVNARGRCSSTYIWLLLAYLEFIY